MPEEPHSEQIVEGEDLVAGCKNIAVDQVLRLEARKVAWMDPGVVVQSNSSVSYAFAESCVGSNMVDADCY